MTIPATDRPPLPAVIVGGGIAGLATARLIARHFERVIVLEKDTRLPAATGDEAHAGWKRPGVPQFGHSHAFLARLRLVLLAHMPEVLERLRLHGVREIALADGIPPGMRFTSRPDDADVVLLAVRRATFEWVLRQCVIERPGIELREGTDVAGLVIEPSYGARSHVRGVRLADGTEIPAAIVVDASGRRSKVAKWLAPLRVPAPYEKTSDTGILYFTRFYRLRGDRQPPAGTGLIAGDVGWVKLATFPGDAGTFSITVGPPVDDGELRRLAEPRVFERFVRAFPGLAPWRAAGVSSPIDGADTPVLMMGQLRNRMRHFVDAEGPLAPGLFVVGDAAYHSNPIYGRGCSSAMAQAALLDEALGHHPGDYVAASHYFHLLSEREIRPFWEAAVASDRRMNGDTRVPDPTDPLGTLAYLAMDAFGWFLERGIVPATRVDPIVFRKLLRVFHMLDTPESLLLDPQVLARALPVLARTVRGHPPEAPFPRVSRDHVLATLGSA